MTRDQALLEASLIVGLARRAGVHLIVHNAPPELLDALEREANAVPMPFKTEVRRIAREGAHEWDAIDGFHLGFGASSPFRPRSDVVPPPYPAAETEPSKEP